MVFLQANSIIALQSLANDYKFWMTLTAVVIAGYKAYDWVKQIRTKDIPSIHSEIAKLSAGLDTLGNKLDTQTTSVVGELKEMRSDFRTFIPHFYNPSPSMMMPVQSRPRKATKPRKKVTQATTVEVVSE